MGINLVSACSSPVTPADHSDGVSSRGLSWAGVFLLAFVSGCDSSSSRPPPDTAIEELGAVASSADVADTIFLDVTQMIGLTDGDSEYLFGTVSAVTADDRGFTFVGDRNGATVRAFDESGRFVSWIAREGGGPGEVVALPAHLLSAEGRLYIRDGLRVTVFGTRSEGRYPDSVIATWNTPGGGNLTSSRSGLARDGRYFYPSGLFLPNSHPRYFYISYRHGEADGDTLEVPAYPGLTGNRPALLRLGADALMLRGLSRVPFGASPSWDITPAGTLISTDGASSVLLETNVRGDTVRTIQLPSRSPQPIPPQERADSLEALEERIARVPGELNQVTGVGAGVVERRLPEYPPAALGLTVAPDGTIWVERWPPVGREDARFYDVLEPSGTLRGVIVLNAPLLRDPPPWFGARTVVGVVRDTMTGVEQVARFDLP